MASFEAEAVVIGNLKTGIGNLTVSCIYVKGGLCCKSFRWDHLALSGPILLILLVVTKL